MNTKENNDLPNSNVTNPSQQSLVWSSFFSYILDSREPFAFPEFSRIVYNKPIMTVFWAKGNEKNIERPRDLTNIESHLS